MLNAIQGRPPRWSGKVEAFKLDPILGLYLPDWTATFGNLVTTAGANDILSKYFLAGTGPSWFVGMIEGATASFAIADTMASHGGWTEVASAHITNATRPAWTGGTVSGGAVDNSASPAQYTMAAGLVGTTTLQGIFMVTNNTLGGTTGTLYGEALFSQGPQTVTANAVLSITAQVTAVAG